MEGYIFYTCNLMRLFVQLIQSYPAGDQHSPASECALEQDAWVSTKTHKAHFFL